MDVLILILALFLAFLCGGLVTTWAFAYLTLERLSAKADK